MYKKGNKMPEIWKNKRSKTENEMLLSNIITCVHQRVPPAYAFFLLNLFSYCVYCYCTFAYI